MKNTEMKPETLTDSDRGKFTLDIQVSLTSFRTQAHMSDP